MKTLITKLHSPLNFLNWTRGTKLVALAVTAACALSAPAQIFLADTYYARVGEYSLSGALINPALLTGFSTPYGVDLDGQGFLYVSDAYGGKVGKYTAAGQTVNASFITGMPNPRSVAFDGNGHMFVADGGGFINEYTTSGTLLNASFISGLGYLSTDCMQVDSSGHLFVFYGAGAGGTLGEWTTSGTAVNASLLSGLHYPGGMALDGAGHLFLGNYGERTIGEYTTAGAVVNSTLISNYGGGGLVLNEHGNLLAYSTGGAISEYTTSGQVVNAHLITGLSSPLDIAIQVPEPSAATLVGMLGALLGCGRKLRWA